MTLYRSNSRSSWLPLGVALLIATLCLFAAVGRAAASEEPEPPSDCAAGAVSQPELQPELVGDCETLLGLRDALRGEAELNWSARLPIGEWRGITVGGDPQRVVELRLESAGLDGALPTELGELSELRRLALSDNLLSGPLPASLGRLTRLESLSLDGNRLTGALPEAWAELWSLRHLALEDNRLEGAVPYWLDDLDLLGLYLTGNAGLSGCLPAGLRGVRSNDLARTGLSWCALQPRRTLTTSLAAGARGRIEPAPGAHAYRRGARVRVRAVPASGYRVAAWSGACAGDESTCLVRLDRDRSVGVSFEPITYSLTVSANEGGTVTPTGTTNYMEPTTVTLSASWNDATHSFTGWSGDCVGTTSTCELLVDNDLTVTATFAELPADRCAAPTASDCIRAVFLGAPSNYAQVVDIPADRLLLPDAEGRYTINRGQQVTVVTAAPLPTGHSRFVANLRPEGQRSPTSRLHLVPPTAVTFSLTASRDAHAPDRFELDLHAARTRPGHDKPIPGPLVLTTRFNVLPDPLELELSSSRDLCTANTLTELSWTITGGKPPYALTIEGQSVKAGAASHGVDCGPLLTDPETGTTLIDQTRAFSATVTGALGDSASAQATVELVAPGAPLLHAQTAASGSVALSWSAESTAGVTGWEYRRRQGDGVWGAWTRISVSDAATTGHTVSGLTMDARYSFHLRAIRGSTAGPRSGTASAVAGLTPTVFSDREMLYYDDLDSSGSAVRPGSYAFLTDAADLTSGATTFAQASSAQALLLNTIGYVGRDYTGVLDTVEVGDRITWHLTSSCWYHYRISAVLADLDAPARKLLRLALVTQDQCGFTADEERSADYFDEFRDWHVVFDWDDPPSQPTIGLDGIRIMPDGYPVDGGHTYRLWGWRPSSIVLDVPEGLRLKELGAAWQSHGGLRVTYVDMNTGVRVALNPNTGRNANYWVPRRDGVTIPPESVLNKFDDLLDSIRRQPAP